MDRFAPSLFATDSLRNNFVARIAIHLPIPHRLQHTTGILAYLQYGHTTDNSSMANGYAGAALLFTPS